MSEEIFKTIKDNGVRFVDLRFTDTRGKEQHVTIPSHTVNEELFTDGKMFDGSSISGWKGINESDMILMPDASTGVMDPFFDEPTLIIRCDIVEPTTGEGYGRDPPIIGRGRRQAAYYLARGARCRVQGLIHGGKVRACGQFHAVNGFGRVGRGPVDGQGERLWVA